MQIKTLEHTSFHTILDCFLTAFENYFVEMPKDPDYFRQRWQGTGVDFANSYGMFDGELLVGFVLQAIGPSRGVLTAYNAGTGVIPAYRGKKIVQALYAQAIADLKPSDVKLLLLEVIIENKKAIKAYQNVGFSICADYPCFSGVLQAQATKPLSLQAISFDQLKETMLRYNNLYAWDNQYHRVVDMPYRCFGYIQQENLVAYVVLNTESGYIAQIECTAVHLWQSFLLAIQQLVPEVKMNNVNAKQKEKIQQITLAGLQQPIVQYELEMWLHKPTKNL